MNCVTCGEQGLLPGQLRGGLCLECAALSLAQDAMAKAADTSKMRVAAVKLIDVR